MTDGDINKIVDYLDVELVKPWHLLFTGANGHETWGIIVRSKKPKNLVEDLGYQREWFINDSVLNEFLRKL